MTESNQAIRRPDEGPDNGATGAPNAAETPSAPHELTRLQALLLALAERVPVERMDQLWIFPPRQAKRTETGLVVAAAFNGADDRRRVVTGRYVARKQDKGPDQIEQIFLEHAVAPADRIPTVIDGVVRRLDDDLAAIPPRHERIGGEVQEWERVLSCEF